MVVVHLDPWRELLKSVGSSRMFWRRNFSKVGLLSGLGKRKMGDEQKPCEQPLLSWETHEEGLYNSRYWDGIYLLHAHIRWLYLTFVCVSVTPGKSHQEMRWGERKDPKCEREGMLFLFWFLYLRRKKTIKRWPRNESSYYHNCRSCSQRGCCFNFSLSFILFHSFQCRLTVKDLILKTFSSTIFLFFVFFFFFSFSSPVASWSFCLRV